ncbi:MAG: BsuBI/PstI family type II restriction endonuclease [Dongiaceae bacterium]
MKDLPPYVTRELVAERLPKIFPKGIPNRNYCIRELAASTVFAMLYIGAVEGTGRYLAPIHVYRMTDKQALKFEPTARIKYAKGVYDRKLRIPGKRWYADNTREPIRDESLRDGLVSIGTVSARDDLPTTSSKPRYALKADFAALFDPNITGRNLDRVIQTFQKSHFSTSALARVTLVQSGAASGRGGLRVTFPNGDTRLLAPGPSSKIAQAVIEQFAPRFLHTPAVLWLSESKKKVVASDDKLAAKINLNIKPDRNLPDLILVDLGIDEILLVFVEIVATDGAITPRRQDALRMLTDEAGFNRTQVAFLTAYLDRESAGFRKTVSGLAWGSFAWFASEPDQIIMLRGNGASPSHLGDLVRR